TGNTGPAVILMVEECHLGHLSWHSYAYLLGSQRWRERLCGRTIREELLNRRSSTDSTNGTVTENRKELHRPGHLRSCVSISTTRLRGFPSTSTCVWPQHRWRHRAS